MNRFLCTGYLTRPPEMRVAPSGTAVTKLGIAVHTARASKDGETQDETCFLDVTLFGKQAETVSQHLTTGDPILLEGRLVLDTWEEKDGGKRSRHSIIADRFEFLPRAKAREESAPPVHTTPSPTPPSAADSEGTPVCRIHHRSMRASTRGGGWYCTQKAEGGGYCAYVITGSGAAAAAQSPARAAATAPRQPGEELDEDDIPF